MDKYEISLWEDYQKSEIVNEETITYLDERKLCVIGADTMTSQARALEPKLTENINGTHTFTFKMFMKYVDNETGEAYDNPFLHLLINERKVKVFWKDTWYDLVIKRCQEDSSGKSIVYTCTDLFINELSKNGFELNFATDLENNIGTVEDLATATLKGTTWTYDSDSDQIYQKNEEPVYEVTVSASFDATLQLAGQEDVEGQSIPASSEILVFYSSISAILEKFEAGAQSSIAADVQFLYSPDGYEREVNNLLVINGNCYQISNAICTHDVDMNSITISIDGTNVFTIYVGQGVSENYRAERLVKSPLTEFDEVVDRYVTVCKENNTNKKVYLIENTEYTDPLAVVNLIANPTQYKNISGWLATNNQDISWDICPKFNSNTSINTYNAKSFLKLYGTIYNTGLSSNIGYLTPTSNEVRSGIIGGFQKGEKYIFRFKAVADNGGSPNYPGSYITSNIVTCEIKDSNVSYFESQYDGEKADNWVEYTLTCIIPCPADSIEDLGIYLTIDGTYWFEDIQFFKYIEGITSYEEGAQPQRMNPGEINLQSIAVKTYKYYYADHPSITDAKQLTYIYIGEQESDAYPIQYNKYEKLATINVKESNRFNILQTIAETFKCWVRFRIEHTPNGKIIFENGIPQKFVTFNAEVGDDKKKLAFEYGIDLKTISRIIDSNSIATKVIVLENSNEFAKDGFCTITRSNENYSKANFILNFDYYVQQGLLAKQQIQKDLYGTSSNDIGYYYHLRWYNRDYDGYSEELITKKMDLVKQNSQLTTYRQYSISASEKLGKIKDDVCKLANVNSWAEAEGYVRTHTNNTKVQTLMNSYAEVNNQINYYNQLIVQAQAALLILKNRISFLNSKLEEDLANIEALNDKFNAKYGSYIQEGTWQNESYTDDDKYYFDATSVSYTSSRPQITYSINVLRLSGLEEFSSKVFKVGDICYMIDREYFGYSDLKTKTPYKEKILVSEITSNFDTPEKDVIQVRNYKTRFDDLFQRIAATTQSLQYSEGEYSRAAEAVNTDKTLSFSLLQDTFDANSNLVINASNQNVTWDETGITVTNKLNSADKTKIIAGGIFVTNDGGETWKNAVRGDGISTDLLTAGRINTSEIYVYDGNHPTFRWDSDGLTAYWHDGTGANFGKFVRHDRFGLYGYNSQTISPYSTIDFIPNSEEQIWDDPNTRFALTWNGFLFNSSNSDGYLKIGSNLVANPTLTEEFTINIGYGIGDLCIYEGEEYIFTSEHEAGAWDTNDVAKTGYKVFDETASYNENDLVFHGENRYRFINSHSGDWTDLDVELITIQNFSPESEYKKGDLVYYNNNHYMFKNAHQGDWSSSDVSQINIVDYMLIYGGLKSDKDNPKFYITQNGNCYFNGAIFTNGSITGSSLRIGGTPNMPAFQVDQDGKFWLRSVVNNNITNCVYFDPQKQVYVFEGQLGADAVFTESLYAEVGDIAELTVDQLSTSKRMRKYNLRDKTDDNYIEIKDQYIYFVTASVVQGEYTETEPKVQAKNRYGSNLYWSKQPVSYTSDGYPLDIDGNQIYITLNETQWPAYIYQYVDPPDVKAQFAFEHETENYIPQIVMGAGDQNGYSKGFVKKDENSLDVWYVDRNGDEKGIYIGDYTDLIGLRKPTELDFSTWDSGSFTEILDGEIINGFAITFDSNNRPISFTDNAGHVTEVTWE